MGVTTSIGEWLRIKRERAGLGLRKFALLIGDSPSNVCNIENEERPPWRNEPRLRKVAEVLGIKEHSEDWDTLFELARKPGQPPADLVTCLQGQMIPVLLRTFDEYQLSEQELEAVLKYVRRRFAKKRSDSNAERG